jgi:hypothetical protein
MDDARRRRRQTEARRLMRALSDGEPMVIDETGETTSVSPERAGAISPEVGFAVLIQQREREFLALQREQNALLAQSPPDAEPIERLVRSSIRP